MIYVVMLSLFAGMLLIGTFYDKEIAEAVYLPHNVVATVLTMTGVYPFFTAVVFLMGALSQRVIHSGKGRIIQVVLCAVCALVAIFVGFIGAAALVDKDCLGGILPSLNRNIPVIFVLSLIVEYPLFIVGYKLAQRSDDALLSKRIIGLIVIIFITYTLMRLLKTSFNRPRYRIAAMGYEGIGFVPWFTPFSGVSGLMTEFGLDRNEFNSFPSGHSVFGISTIYILLSLTWFFPKLRDKRIVLCTAGLLFGVVIMLTRMVLGAHYLSDVSAGAIIGTVLVLANNFIQNCISKSKDIS